MEKDGPSAPAAYANFSQQCYFFPFSRILLNVFAFFCAILGFFANIAQVLAFFAHILCANFQARSFACAIL